MPQFGAQVWIEPGQTDAEIDSWFATLESSRMPVARLFMMWNYLEPKRDTWDWSLYDAAFRSAERHHVAIVATLTPSGMPFFAGANLPAPEITLLVSLETMTYQLAFAKADDISRHRDQ